MEQILKGPLFQDPQMLTNLIGSVLKIMPAMPGGMGQVLQDREEKEETN